MEWQLAVTGTIIALAIGFIAWRVIAALRTSKDGCSGGCGCSKATDAKSDTAVIAPEQLVLRERKTQN